MEAPPDGDFYQLIQQLAQAIGSNQNRERRRQPRITYRVIQRIAPWTSAGFPLESSFFEVACRDLSRGGFSYFSPMPPDVNSVVVELGNPPDTMYVLAEVLHHRQVVMYPSGEVKSAWSLSGNEPNPSQQQSAGLIMYLVGCRFVRRLRKPKLTAERA